MPKRVKKAEAKPGVPRAAGRRACRLVPAARRRVAVGILILAALAAWAYFQMTMPAHRTGTLVTVNVKAGESIVRVARKLDGAGLIRSAPAFVLTAVVSGRWRRIEAGLYELIPTLSGWEILRRLGLGGLRWRRLTIPEGFSLAAVARAVEQHHLGEAAEFQRLATWGAAGFPTPFPKPVNSLEGYLFPDTYHVGITWDERRIIVRMLERFDEVVWRGLLRQPVPGGTGAAPADPHARTSTAQVNLHQVITLASLVEGEAKWPEERPKIAGVLMNRLHQGRRLECDATIQYLLGDRRKPNLTIQDLQIDSRYNTYRYAGLPPGPINNPGLASIRAALAPATVPYLYYVATADGHHIFTRTYEEHLAAKRRARGQ